MSQVFMLVCLAMLLVSASVRQAVCLTQPLRRLSRNNCQRRIVGIEPETLAVPAIPELASRATLGSSAH